MSCMESNITDVRDLSSVLRHRIRQPISRFMLCASLERRSGTIACPYHRVVAITTLTA